MMYKTNEQLFIRKKDPMNYSEKNPISETNETVHPDIVQLVGSGMPPEEELFALAELFRMFSDSTRIRILYALSFRELCVCDIAASLNMTQSAISHQLRALRQGRLVRCRREGKTVFYSLADHHVMTILAQGMEHTEE